MRTSVKRTIFIRRCLERGHSVANTLGSRGLPPVVRAQGANLGLGLGSGSGSARARLGLGNVVRAWPEPVEGASSWHRGSAHREHPLAPMPCFTPRRNRPLLPIPEQRAVASQVEAVHRPRNGPVGWPGSGAFPLARSPAGLHDGGAA